MLELARAAALLRLAPVRRNLMMMRQLAAMATTTTTTATTPTTAVPCAPPPIVHPRSGRRVQAVVALSGGVDSAVAALLARERFGAQNVLCVWARTWDAGDEEGSGSGGTAGGTAPSCYGGTGSSCSPVSSSSSPATLAAPAPSTSAATPAEEAPVPSPVAVTPSACEAEADLRSAQGVAKALGLPFVEADLRAAYWTRVFEQFLADSAGGSATPNPDLGCNSAVKFGALQEFARAAVRQRHRVRGQGVAAADGSKNAEDDDDVVLVTGHYARVGLAAVENEETAGARPSSLPPHPLGAAPPPSSSARLLRGVDARKDQSYFLSSLSSEQLARSWFPIGEASSKADVREAARRAAAEAAAAEAGKGGGGGGGGTTGGNGSSALAALAAVAARRSSAGICFVGRRRRFAEFLEGYLEPVPGRFVCCETGADLGACANLLAVTHGQRAPLEGGAMAAAVARGDGDNNNSSNSGGDTNKSMNPRWYVVGKDMEQRVAHVAAGRDHRALRSRSVLLEAPRWVAAAAAAADAPSSDDKGDKGAPPPLPFEPGALLQYKARYRQETPGWCRVRLATAEEAAERAGPGSDRDGASARTSFRASRFFQRSPASPLSSSASSPSSSQPPLLLVAELTEPAHAPTPGQAFVIYRGDECLGSATIAAPGRTVFEEEEGGSGG